jgi:hypothetical protein
LNKTFEVNGDKLFVEERRLPRQNGQNFQHGNFQGRGGRGGPQGAPRGGGNFPQGNRGNFGPRGRGAAGAPPRGGRGGPAQ